MAAPQVTATAALMKSLDPTLTAEDIKQYPPRQRPTRGPEPAPSIYIDPRLGAGVLATDQAVLAVINRVRASQCLDPDDPNKCAISAEQLEARGSSTPSPSARSLPAGQDSSSPCAGIVRGCHPGCTGVSIAVSGEHAFGGDTTGALTTPGEVSWSVTLKTLPATILVKRTDNGAGSLISITATTVVYGHYAGTWEADTVDCPEGWEFTDARAGTIDIVLEEGQVSQLESFMWDRDSYPLMVDGNAIQWAGEASDMLNTDLSTTPRCRRETGRRASQGPSLASGWSFIHSPGATSGDRGCVS